jgi:hypothetical protein
VAPVELCEIELVAIRIFESDERTGLAFVDIWRMCPDPHSRKYVSTALPAQLILFKSLTTVPAFLNLVAPKIHPADYRRHAGARDCPNPSVANRRVTLFLFRRELEFAVDEPFNALIACQTQTDERTLALQIDVKIKKRAAYAFGNDPIG